MKKSRPTWNEAFNLFKDYFANNDHQYKAYLLLFGSIVCVIALVALMSSISWCVAAFFAALQAKAFASFLICIEKFVVLVSAYVGLSLLQNYCMSKLAILWRTWLTTQIIDKLFNSPNNYKELKRLASDMDNLAQRIQQDIDNYITLTLSLSMNFLRSLLSLGTFIATLWIVGGALSATFLGLNIVIPGYLVWVALVAAISATAITNFLGKSLSTINKQSEKAEADLREGLAQLNHDAENIAEEHAEPYYKALLEQKIKDISNTSNQKLNTQTKILSFQNFYLQLSMILPDLLAAPLYFAGLIEIGQLMQVGMAFGQVSGALNWFANSFETLAYYKSSIERVVELQNKLDGDGLHANNKDIFRKERNKDWIRIKRLTIKKPQAGESSPIVQDINLKITPGQHVLIKGPSGVGKSTFIKVLSGSWLYGTGKVALPSERTIDYLPQNPSIPFDTLKAVLAYPKPSSSYSSEKYIEVLTKVGMAYLKTDLDTKCAWSDTLSGGMKQRISFARVLLRKPHIVVLDEATSGLDESNEEAMYALWDKDLKDTTRITVAHRSTVQKHYHKILFFKKTEPLECYLIRELTSPKLENLAQIEKNQYIITPDEIWYYDCTKKCLKQLNCLKDKLASFFDIFNLDENRLTSEEDLNTIKLYTGHNQNTVTVFEEINTNYHGEAII